VTLRHVAVLFGTHVGLYIASELTNDTDFWFAMQTRLHK